ncbi:MAG: terminase large subunit domain-containing protein [Promethearchaeota archaeon]
MNIISAIMSADFFKSLFPTLKTWKNWLVCLKAIFAIQMNREELEIYRKFTKRKYPPKKPFKEVFLVIGRRGGKSFISAVIAVFLALFKDWSRYLRPGEIGWIFVISSDRDQSRIVLNYIKEILRLPQFADQVEDELTNQIRLKNSITIEVRTASWRGLRGYTVCAAICDELGVWRSEESSNPSKEIIAALKPCMLTVKDEALLLGISTPHARKGVLWEKFRDKYGKDDLRTLVWRATSMDMNPTIPQEEIDEALKEDYAVAKAEYLSVFREDLESYMTEEMIEAVTAKSRLAIPPISGIRYFAFCDMSSGRRDSSCLAITFMDYSEDNKIRLARLAEYKSPHDPKFVIKSFCEILRDYGIHRCEGDRYSAGFVESEFRDNGIRYVNCKSDKSDLYIDFQALVSMKRVELLDNKRLSLQLQSLERRVRMGQHDRIDHPEGLHDDLANACAGACVMASRVLKKASPQELQGRRPVVSTRPISARKRAEMDREQMEKDFVQQILRERDGTANN